MCVSYLVCFISVDIIYVCLCSVVILHCLVMFQSVTVNQQVTVDMDK